MPLLPVPHAQRGPLLSLFQSAAAERAASVHGQLEQAAAAVARVSAAGRAPPVTAPAGIAADSWTCARLGLAWLEARLRDNPAEAARLAGDLHGATCDPGWLETLVAYADHYGPDGNKRLPYRPPSAETARILPLPPSARIALVSDWGLGTEAAERVLAQALSQHPDVLIHLGDVYYSGTEREYAQNFRKPLVAALASAGLDIPVYLLCGNHDMYAGGEGFYATIDQLNHEPVRQRASWFCLRSPDNAWQLLAMDTGLHDRDPFDDLTGRPVQTFLEPAELAWHQARITEFPGRTILLSHHPLFSAFAPVGPTGPDGRQPAVNRALFDGFRTAIEAGRIAGWFWGHEHALSLYAPYLGLRLGRCVGNGAIPVLIEDNPHKPLPGLTDPPSLLPGIEQGQDGAIWAHGSALLNLGPSPTAEYYQTISPTPLYVESLAEPRIV